MASNAPTNRGRLRLAVAGAAVLTALTVATAGGSPPAPMGGQAAGLVRLGADSRPRSFTPEFLLERGRYTPIAFPGALTTTAVGINKRGQVVGEYKDTGGRIHGYVWERGRFTTVDAPGAAATTLTDINDRGQILGGRLEPDGTGRGFVLEQGRYTVFAARGPGSPRPTPSTLAFGLNDRGQITGAHNNPNPPRSPQRSGIPPMGRMA